MNSGRGSWSLRSLRVRGLGTADVWIVVACSLSVVSLMFFAHSIRSTEGELHRQTERSRPPLVGEALSARRTLHELFVSFTLLQLTSSRKPNLFVNAPLASQVLKQACPNTTLFSLVAKVAQADVRSQARLMIQIARSCPKSVLPFVGRELWLQHVDAAVRTPDDSDLEAVHGCLKRKDRTRACILFVHSGVAYETAEVIYEHLTLHPDERIVAISASNIDVCVPFIEYSPDKVTGLDPHASAPAFMKLLEHERLLLWLTENPCIMHPKLVPIPLGPKFKWHSTKWGSSIESYVGVKRRLANMMEQAVRQGRGNRTRRLMVAVSPWTSEDSWYADFVGVRNRFYDHMLAVAEVDPAATKLEHSVTEYLMMMTQHKFVWAPPGAGIDTHRAWEALLAGSIPITLSSPLSPVLRGTQAMEVDDYRSISIARLEHTWLHASHALEDWLSPKLFAFYWLDLIDRAARRSS